MDIFDEISEQFGEETKTLAKGEKPVKEYIVVAYQIVRISKVFSFGDWKHTRQIIDTICVEHGCTEKAKNEAVIKGQRHGNCMIVEILERQVITIQEQKLQGTTLYKNGAKKLARTNNR